MKIKEIIIMTVIAVLMALVCCVLAPTWNPNVATIISGLWSAVATAAVGAIAYWQNKQYKMLADRLDEKEKAPEFFIPTIATDVSSFVQHTFNKISAHGEDHNGMCFERKFTIIDKPVLHLRPVDIVIDSNKYPLRVDGESEINVYKVNDSFEIKFDRLRVMDDGVYPCRIGLAYENIYGDRYIKELEFSITVKDKQIVNKTWGKLTRAKRSN